MTVKKIEKRNILLTHLVLREGFNARSDDDDPIAVQALADLIDADGLIHDVSVVEDPKREGFYIVVSGSTRARALLHLAKTKPLPPDQEVTVSVVTSDPTSLFVQNLTENVARRELRPADIAKRAFELTGGECKSFDGQPLPPISVKLLSDRLGKSPSFVRELIRAWRGACPAVRKAWQKDEIVTDQVRNWCKLPEDEQKKALKRFLSGEEAEEAREAAEAEAAEEAGESSSKSNGAKNGNGKHEEKEPKGPTRSEVLAKAEAFAEKLDKGEFTGEDKKVARAKWEALRWAAGDIRRLGYT